MFQSRSRQSGVSLARRCGGSHRRFRVTPSLVSRCFSATTKSSVLSQEEQEWHKKGILDERGLVKFDTLHNMQVRSCQVYAPKNLFATYSPDSQQFEWMTYVECTYILCLLAGWFGDCVFACPAMNFVRVTIVFCVGAHVWYDCVAQGARKS